MFTPKGAVKLSDIQTMQQIRLGLQGAPKTGKTFAATTFPNPVFINLDRGLGAHTGKENILEIPVWKEIDKKTYIENFIEREAPQLTEEQTLVIDGSTGLQNAFHAWYPNNKLYTKYGKENEFGEWNLKLEFFTKITEKLKSLKCHVVYIAHEVEARDKPKSPGEMGEYTGKLKPLLRGGFGDELAGHFTDWFRTHAVEKPRDYSTIKPESLANWGMTKVEEFKAMCDSFINCPSIYYWQTFSDASCDCGASSLVGAPKFIPATYQSFIKYARKTTISNEGKV